MQNSTAVILAFATCQIDTRQHFLKKVDPMHSFLRYTTGLSSLGVPGVPGCHGTHSANFDEKVHKPQSKYYGRIVANMQLIFTHILWILILLSAVHHNFWWSEGLQGNHIDALHPFSSKLMTLTLRGGLWTFSANLALCAPVDDANSALLKRFFETIFLPSNSTKDPIFFCKPGNFLQKMTRFT